MFVIKYSADSFPPGTGSKLAGRHQEQFSWAELVHSAATVGRKNWHDVLSHGSYSVLEVLWRIAMLRANLVDKDGQLAPSIAYRHLERTEKGVVYFFIGLCVAKLFSQRLFDVPWLLHLDVYRQVLNPQFNVSRRPDFVGMDASNRWIVVEAKGRTGDLPESVLDKAKEQTRSLLTIGGQSPVLRVAIGSFFASNKLRARLRDPEGPLEDAVPIDVTAEQVARVYYTQLFEFIEGVADRSRKIDLQRLCVEGVNIPGMDATIRTTESLARWYFSKELTWEDVVATSDSTEAGQTTLERYEDAMKMPESVRRVATDVLEYDAVAGVPPRRPNKREFEGRDQVSIALGQSWADELMEREPPGRAG